MLPDRASLFVAGAAANKDDLAFWDSVYGFDFKCIKKLAMIEPLVDCVDDKQICTTISKLISLDLKTVKKSDLVFEVPSLICLEVALFPP